MEAVKQIPYGVADFQSVIERDLIWLCRSSPYWGSTPRHSDAQGNLAVLRMGTGKNGRSVIIVALPPSNNSFATGKTVIASIYA